MPPAAAPPRRAPPLSVLALLSAVGALACGKDDPQPVADASSRGPAPSVLPAAPALRRLTHSQYHNAITDLFGADLYIPSNLEPDNDVEGLLSVGASTTSVSAYGVELYESAAYLVAEQVVEDPEVLGRLMVCTPSSAGDADCAAEIVTSFGARAWRRPLSADEIDRLSRLVASIGTASGEFEEGLTYGIGAILQSPHFLYRREHGAGDGELRELTDWELASRLSFLLWNSIPDDELLRAAEAGELQDPVQLESQARRMLDDDKARQGLRNLFDEVFHLYGLESLTKDPLVFTFASPELGPAAREETLLGIEALVLDDDGDFRDLFTSQRTFVDRRLAALYNVAATTDAGFSEVWLPDNLRRRGLFGQASFLLLQSHPTSTSATRRGAFIRSTVLCQEIPPPPADVDTSIPEADASSPTLRERLATHLEDPYCASCHTLTDPVGLAFENFDGIGRWRLTENEATIDASGTLDNVSFQDAWGAAQVVARHPNLGRCMTRHVYRYSTGRLEADGEDDLLDWLAAGFDENHYSFQDLLVETVLSEGFRKVGAIQ